MQRSSGNWKWGLMGAGLALAAGAVMLLLPGRPSHAAGQPQLLRREQQPFNILAVDSAVRLLRSGDLALRTGADATSYLLRQMNLSDKTYSHCGIVMVEDGYPFVYHSIGGEDNPDAALRRDSAQLFFSPAGNERLGIARLDLNGTQVRQLSMVVRRYYRQALKFDLDFDMATDDRMYCAEFAYKAVTEAVADTGYFTLTRALSHTYAGVDNLYDRRHAKIICDVRFK